MSLWIEIKRCYRSLLLHRMRTLLSTLGIFFGVVAVIAMLSIGEGAKRESLQQIEQLGTSIVIVRERALSEEQHQKARGRLSKGLSLLDLDLFKTHLSFAETLVPIKEIKTSLSGTQREIAPEILATTKEFRELKNYSLDEGRFLSEEDVLRKARVCVLGYEVAKKLGAEGHVGSVIRLENIPFIVVGILENTHWVEGKSSTLLMHDPNQTLFIPLGSHACLPQSTIGRENLSSIALQFHDQEASSIGAQQVERLLQVYHGEEEDYQIVIPRELIEQAYQTQRIYNLVLGIIAALSLIVGGIGIMNIMLANVSERTKEIGIRRAVGANQKDILLQFLGETLLLTLLGALAGIIIGILFSWIVSSTLGWNTIVTGWSLFLSLLMASSVGICAGLYPAKKAASTDPITALRSF